jgi:hypothetical protein
LSFVGINIAAVTVEHAKRGRMRILVIQRPTVNCIDGMRLDRFMPGHQYEVATSLAAVFIAEKWAEPVTGAPPVLAPLRGEFSRDAGAASPELVRSTYPARPDGPAAVAADRPDRPRSKPPST